MTTTIVLLLGLLLVEPVIAAVPSPIEKMRQAPASAFDVFVFRIYEAAKCNNVLKNTNADEADLCLSSIRYDVENSVLNTFFRVFPAATGMEDFVDQDAAGRKAILLKLLDNTVRRIGAVDSW